MKNARSVMVVAIALVLAVASPLAIFAADTPPAAYLPGILQADGTPNGCVSCHQGNYSIPNELKKVEGHPDVSKMVKVVPEGCAVCHKEGAKIPSLAKVVHMKHFGPDATKNVFVQHYAGSCLNCHKLDVSTGAMSIKSGKANW
ncbi:MAG TPA: hypothetical protein VMV44_15155 [Rectinemataceae bacterium]|nr:hypothetical protein [Rectinemataceae bacterium]